MTDLTAGAALVAAFLSRSQATHLLAGALDGTLRGCNAAAASALGVEAGSVAGQPMWRFLTEPDRAHLRAALAAGPGRTDDLRLNLVGASQHPYTLECVLEVGEGFTLLGEESLRHGRELQDELLRINEDLGVLAREHARTRRELERTLADLRASHWHIEKLQEVLPMCLECGRVHVVGERWETPRTFLKAHTTFLSHGYCPDCIVIVKARFASEG